MRFTDWPFHEHPEINGAIVAVLWIAAIAVVLITASYLI